MSTSKANIPYRLELRVMPENKTYYYLVKDIKVRGRKINIRKFIGQNKPSEEEILLLSEKYAYEIENKAIAKEVEINSNFLKTTYIDKETLKELETTKSVYKKYTKLLTASESCVYEQNFEMRYVQGTTAIEGNTLTLSQTRDLLENDILPNGKTLREINEIQNFKQVKKYRDQYAGKITLDFIKELHFLIMNNIDYHSAGNFRRIDTIAISGCDISVTPAELIETELKDLIDNYYISISAGNHPFEETALFHYKFEMIHPFTDGNGRVGREIFNYMLSKNGYPRMLFLGTERANYIKMLHLGNEENYGEMITKFAHLMITQRLSILLENLKKIVIPLKKGGQLRLQDFLI
ncbi:MAG: Fic family protein [Candidatus Bathyarchaeota archaeon]|nr:Fic family protein [Candidatus Termiticorpusculum sp.]